MHICHVYVTLLPHLVHSVLTNIGPVSGCLWTLVEKTIFFFLAGNMTLNSEQQGHLNLIFWKIFDF